MYRYILQPTLKKAAVYPKNVGDDRIYHVFKSILIAFFPRNTAFLQV